MKKMLAIMLSLCMVLSLLTGCGPTGGNETTGAAGEGQADNENVTITIGLPENLMVEDYDTNAFTAWLEEETGYNLEFMMFPTSGADYRSKLSTMFLSGEKLPDILWNFQFNDSVYEEYGEDGYFLDLSEYLLDKEKSAVWWESFEQIDEEYANDIMRYITHDDGGIYTFPRVETSPYDCIDTMAYINQTWLDTLNLEMPTDPDSLYTVLKAFKTQDPNGNGQADEIPLIGRAGTIMADVTDWIINMFTYHDSLNYHCLDENGNLYLPATTDAYRQALIYINKLVKEGLLDTGCWSVTQQQMMGLINPVEGAPQTVGMWVDHPTLVLEVGHEAVYDYAAVPFMGYCIMNENLNTRRCFVTEAAADKMDAVWNLLMVMSSPDGARRMRYGEYGVDWTDADPGTTSFLGIEAEIKVINEAAFSERGNQTWGVVGSTILLYAENENCQLTDDSSDWTKAKMAMMRDTHDYAWARYEADGENAAFDAPTIVLSTEVAESTRDMRDNCENWITNCRASFCTGSMDPNDDAQWEYYLSELEKMGVNDWTKLMQETMEAAS